MEPNWMFGCKLSICECALIIWFSVWEVVHSRWAFTKICSLLMQFGSWKEALVGSYHFGRGKHKIRDIITSFCYWGQIQFRYLKEQINQANWVYQCGMRSDSWWFFLLTWTRNWKQKIRNENCKQNTVSFVLC